MFTGLVEAIGEIGAVRAVRGAREIVVRSSFPAADLRRGSSIAIQGVCLTLIDDGAGDGTFHVQAVAETLRRSTIGELGVGDSVHLERALRVGDRLGGHLVQGHVDAIGRVRRAGRVAGEYQIEIGMPARMGRYLVEKGSIAINGVSLTVGRVDSGRFRVHLIPATLRATRLGNLRVGTKVNLEFDVIAKYVESMLGGRSGHRGADSKWVEEDVED